MNFSGYFNDIVSSLLVSIRCLTFNKAIPDLIWKSEGETKGGAAGRMVWCYPDVCKDLGLAVSRQVMNRWCGTHSALT